MQRLWGDDLHEVLKERNNLFVRRFDWIAEDDGERGDRSEYNSCGQAGSHLRGTTLQHVHFVQVQTEEGSMEDEICGYVGRQDG